MDATDEFNGIHSSKAKGMLADYYIGDLATADEVAAAANGKATTANGSSNGNGVAHVNGNGVVAAAKAAPAAAAAAVVSEGGELVALNPRKKLAVPLIERRELSHNTRLFRFGLPSAEHKVRGEGWGSSALGGGESEGGWVSGGWWV